MTNTLTPEFVRTSAERELNARLDLLFAQWAAKRHAAAYAHRSVVTAMYRRINAEYIAKVSYLLAVYLGDLDDAGARRL